MRRLLIFLSFALVMPLFGAVRPLAAQPSHLALSTLGGKVIPTSGSPLAAGNFVVGLNACLLWQQADTTVYWQRFWCIPYLGIRTGFSHHVAGIAGDCLVFAGTLQTPVTHHLDWTISTGLSFYTLPYSRTHDPENSYIGSVANSLIDLGFLYNLPLDGNITFFLSAKLVHSSNGYMYKPNHGLNSLQAEVGLRLGPRRQTLRLPLADTTFRPYGCGFVMIAPSAVMSRYDPLDQITYYPAYTAQIGYLRHLHPCFAGGGTLDLSYNFSHTPFAPEGQYPVYPAASLFADSQWGPLVLRLGVAHYLAYYPLNRTQYYERVALYCRIGPAQDRYAGVGMKVHGDHIDFIEWTYAIEF